jgi:hypothetical protein
MEHFLPHLPLAASIFLVALVYSSVGHGGASGYLAVLSFFAFSHEQMAASALILNLFVAGVAFLAYWNASHFSWKLSWPFITMSIPAAFLGGLIKVSPRSYALLLIGVLLFAAFRMLFVNVRESRAGLNLPYNSTELKSPPLLVALVLGAGIGILSGIVGVGGGIFLSPLLILFAWADPKQTAATSAFFIVVNSLAGLLGRILRADLTTYFSPQLLLIILVAFLGGILGSHLGANYFPNKWLKRILGLVLIAATIKLFRFVL